MVSMQLFLSISNNCSRVINMRTDLFYRDVRLSFQTLYIKCKKNENIAKILTPFPQHPTQTPATLAAPPVRQIFKTFQQWLYFFGDGALFGWISNRTLKKSCLDMFSVLKLDFTINSGTGSICV